MSTDLRAELAEMFKADLGARTVLWRTMKEEGQQSKEYAEAQARAEEAFSSNAMRLSAILDAQGWPCVAAVGEEASESAFLMLQHADVRIQKKYLPMLRAATARGDIKASLLPLLEDRILMSGGREQIYGTQFHHDEDGHPALWPIRDVDSVDERRKEIGLPPLRDYLQKAGLGHLDPNPERRGRSS